MITEILNFFDEQARASIANDVVAGVILAAVLAVLGSLRLNKSVTITNDDGVLAASGTDHLYLRKFKPDDVDRQHELKANFPRKVAKGTIGSYPPGTLYYSRYSFTFFPKKVRTGKPELATSLYRGIKRHFRRSFWERNFPRLYIHRHLKRLLKRSDSNRFTVSITVRSAINFRLFDAITPEEDGGIYTPWFDLRASKKYTYALLRFFDEDPQGGEQPSNLFDGTGTEGIYKFTATRKEVKALASYLSSTQSWADIRNSVTPMTPEDFKQSASLAPQVNGVVVDMKRPVNWKFKTFGFFEGTSKKSKRHIQMLGGNGGERGFVAFPSYVQDESGLLLEGKPNYTSLTSITPTSRKVFVGEDGLVLWQLEEGHFERDWVAEGEFERLRERLLKWSRR